jgi:hypothetical protein
VAIDRGNADEAVDVEELIEELEQKVERLKILYEQYFMGIERMEPQTARKEIVRKLLELTQMNIRNTAIRYRFNALNQKWGVYLNYWNRTLRSIENGTYVRNVARAGRDAVRRGVAMPEEVLKALPQRLRDRLMKDRAALEARDKKEAERKAKKAAITGVTSVVKEPEAPPPPRPGASDELDAAFANLTSTPTPAKPAARPPPIPPPRPQTAPPRVDLPPGMNEAAARQLYERYVSAKRVVGEDVSQLRYESVIKSLAKQAPKIMSDHQARGVEFAVVIKDKKVILKATPKK